MNAVILSSERLIYEPLGISHLSKRYLEWMNDKEVTKFLDAGGDYTMDKLKNFLKNYQKKKILFWAIKIKKSGLHIGNIKIDPIEKISKIGHYGILIGDREEWGKGYAFEASETIIDFCFKKLILSEIILGVQKKNIYALRLYLKLGFKIYERADHSKIYKDVPEYSIMLGLKNDR